MPVPDFLKYRLYNQQICFTHSTKPHEVVAQLVAMQAQDYYGALWSVGLRMPAATEKDIIQAIADKSIVRTWPMRGTLHFVSAADIRWMLKLLAPRVIASAAGRHRQLELDEKTFTRSKKILTRALAGNRQLTRNELFSILEKGRIATASQRGLHLLQRLALEGLICFAPHQGKQPAFALLDEWLPKGKELTRDEALAELAQRYFHGHGPATLYDFAWWSGLKISDAKKGLDMVSSQLTSVNFNDITYWMQEPKSSLSKQPSTVFMLPGFDEYMLGYKNRSVILDKGNAAKIVPGNNGMFRSTVVINGHVAGTWQRTLKKEKVTVDIEPFTPLSKAKYKAIDLKVKQYAKFLGKSLV